MPNALEGLELLWHSIDNECMLQHRKRYCSTGKDETTVKQIVTDLVDKKVYTRIQGREGYPSFPDFNINLLNGLNYQDLHAWITGLLDKWALGTCDNI